MAHKSSKLVTIAFLVLTLVSPMFASARPHPTSNGHGSGIAVKRSSWEFRLH
jgi:hypothetical protein